jgi:hypothetical protein
MKTAFLRALESENKAATLLVAIRDPDAAWGIHRFEMDPASFAAVPRSPFSYWVSDQVRKLFVEQHALEAPELGRIARRGLGTNDDFRFLRLWTEVPRGIENWPSLAKGGVFSRFYASLPLVLDWRHNGAQLRAFFIQNGESPSRNIRSESEYYRPGITWPLRTQGGLALRAMPGGCIFGSKGPVIFVKNDISKDLLVLLAIANAKPFRALVELQMAFGSYEVGVIQRTPVPTIPHEVEPELHNCSRRIWSLARTLDTANETSHAFLLPAPLLRRVTGFAPSAVAAEISRIQAKVDDIAFHLYGVAGADRAAIEAWSREDAMKPTGAAEDSDHASDIADEEEDGEVTASDADALMSWAAGVAFGRFDIRLATGKRALPSEPEPFDPLPAKSPGMIPDGDAPFRPCHGILSDDPGHRDDFAARIISVYERVGELAPEPELLRGVLAREFFSTHVSTYSKSRRKAPIYWQLATASGSYSVWLYIHAFGHDTLFQVQNDYVMPKLEHERRRLELVRAESGPNPAAGARKLLVSQEAFVEELRAFLEELKRVVPLWGPNLDDGVTINFAPLWRMVPQHRAWQRELKATWEALCAGGYDWARLAMRLWPGRVVPKCLTDRSLAIAHDLENIFWVESLSGRWRQRVSVAETVEYLEKGLPSKKLQQTVRELKEFWTVCGQATEQGRTWWEALSSGVHDDHALALALWPERVLSKCLHDLELALKVGVVSVERSGRSLGLGNLRKRYPPRHTDQELAVLDAFCGPPASPNEWARRWLDFHAGALDDEPLARFVYPSRVVSRAQQDHAFSVGHELSRWFWLETPNGPRRLREPAEERAAAIRQRQSAAVAAALAGLLAAPAPATGRSRQRRAAPNNGGR